MDYGQEADIQGLKESVYDLIGMTTHIGLNLFMKMAAFNLIVFILRM